MRYAAFDVETPNYRNDRISAIGITVLEDGQVVRELSTLVDPETHFDPFNVDLTGITPEAVAGKRGIVPFRRHRRNPSHASASRCACASPRRAAARLPSLSSGKAMAVWNSSGPFTRPRPITGFGMSPEGRPTREA